MPLVGPLGLVALIREVSAGEIRKQADQVPRVVLCGTPAERKLLQDMLLAGSEKALDRARLAQSLVEIDLPLEGDEIVRSLQAQVLFTLAPPDDSLRRLKVLVFQIADAETLRRAAHALADQQGEWLLSLGLHVPALRQAAADRLIASTASVNAQIALISALPGVAPLTQVLLPSAAAADIVLLTKNQIMLILKLAAVHGKAVEIGARLWEIAPAIGGAFGWRALAREMAGAVPGGWGVVAKGTVAYAGTYTVGKVAHIYYTRGKRPTAAEEKRIYAEALVRAREVVTVMAARIRRKKGENREKETESHAASG